MGNKETIAHQAIVKNGILPAYNTGEPVTSYDNEMRLMFTDALAPNGKSAKIGETILESAKDKAEKSRFNALTKQMSADDLEF